MTWLGTNSGKKIDLLNPDPAQICVEDIAHGLSNLCRFNGQIKRFYSVAEHSMHVAALVPNKYKLQALLHDATEAYICDIPTPLKHLLGPAYYDVESRLARAISDALDVELVNLPPCVKDADQIMLMTEHENLQNVALHWEGYDHITTRFPGFIAYEGRTREEACAEFIRKVHSYAAITL